MRQRARRRCRACRSRGGSAVAFGVFVLSAVALPVLRAAQARRCGQDGPPHRARRQLVDCDRRAAGVLFVRAATSCSSARCSCAIASPIGWRESYQITMAGFAATRLFAAGGAGGIALTAWALRRSGMEPRLVALPDGRFHGVLYMVYAGSLLIDGHRPGHRPVPRRRLVRDHDRAGDRGGAAVRGGRCDGAAARRHRAAARRAGRRLGPPGALAARGGDGARAGGERRAYRDRRWSAPRPGAVGRLGLVGL